MDGYNIPDAQNNIGGLGRWSLNILFLSFTNFDKNKSELDKRGVSSKFLLLNFINLIKDKPKLDKRNIKKNWDCMAYIIYSLAHARFSKTIDSQIYIDWFKKFQILTIVYILE